MRAPEVATEAERPLPPSTAAWMVSLALIVAGGIYLSGHLPPRTHQSRLALLAPRSCSSRSCIVSPHARQGFACNASSRSGIVVARLRRHRGNDRYVFLRDHVRGGALVVLTLSLAVFTVHVPSAVGFTGRPVRGIPTIVWPPEALESLRDFEANNDRDWFRPNRAATTSTWWRRHGSSADNRHEPRRSQRHSAKSARSAGRDGPQAGGSPLPCVLDVH